MEAKVIDITLCIIPCSFTIEIFGPACLRLTLGTEGNFVVVREWVSTIDPNLTSKVITSPMLIVVV
jgi:hypothetical protein